MLTARHEAEARIEACRSARRLCRQAVRAARAGAADRQYSQALRAAAVETLEQIAFGPYVLSSRARRTAPGEEIIHLTDREREMLRILAVSPGETVPRAALTGGGTVTSARSTCRSTACGARSERDPANPLFLQAVRGIGYRLVASP